MDHSALLKIAKKIKNEEASKQEKLEFFKEFNILLAALRDDLKIAALRDTMDKTETKNKSITSN